MTKVIYNSKFPAIDRDEFLTPFDRMFDKIVSAQFPEIEKQVGVKPFSGTAYPNTLTHITHKIKPKKFWE